MLREGAVRLKGRGDERGGEGRGDTPVVVRVVVRSVTGSKVAREGEKL